MQRVYSGFEEEEEEERYWGVFAFAWRVLLEKNGEVKKER